MIVLRLYKNETLLTRNYYHLYHQIELKYKNKLYLVPQIFNSLALIVISIITIGANNINFNNMLEVCK